MSKSQLVLVRAFPTDIERTGHRQLTGRLVPYGIVTNVLDQLPDGKLDVYQEGFRPGAFAPQVNTREQRIIAKIGLVHTHEGGLGYLGPFTGLREEADGLYGDVSILRSKADDVDDLIEAGIKGLSVEFRVPRANATETDDQGVRWRTRAHLDKVALEPKGAYDDAEVLAFRADHDAAELEEAAAGEEESTDEDASAEARDRWAELQEKDRQRREADAEASAERHRRFEELAGRLLAEQQRQDELVRRYGITRPGGYQRL